MDYATYKKLRDILTGNDLLGPDDRSVALEHVIRRIAGNVTTLRNWNEGNRVVLRGSNHDDQFERDVEAFVTDSTTDFRNSVVSLEWVDEILEGDLDGEIPDNTLNALAGLVSEYPAITPPQLPRRLQNILNVGMRSYEAFRSIDDAMYTPALSNALSSAVKEVNLAAAEKLQQISKNVAELQSKAPALEAEVKTVINKYEKAFDNFKESAEPAFSRVLHAETKADQMLQTLEAIEENYDNFTKAIEGRFQVQTTRDLWDKRARASSEAFWASAVLLAVLLVVLPMVGIQHRAELLSALEQINLIAMASEGEPSAAQLTVGALNRLVLIAFPLALYVWTVRLVVRFNLRSLALADDARLRQTMMDTFYRLGVDGGASKEERQLMLNALYRPPPGQPADTIDFPNVVELVTKGGSGDNRVS